MPKTQAGGKPVPVKDRFETALAALVEEVKRDRAILAAILCGSLSHDNVWAKSDIDLMLVTVDDKKPGNENLCLYADGINVHAMLVARAEFRKTAEGALRNSFMHSYLAKGRLLYTHDETIADLFESLRTLGKRDQSLHLVGAASQALYCLYKARKFLFTRGDLEYTAVWILNAANGLAKIELFEAGLLVDRESLPQAAKRNPGFFKLVYSDLLNVRKTHSDVEAALLAGEQYLKKRAVRIFAPILDHLSEAGEARSATEIEDYFRRNYGIEGVTIACEYLSDQGVIGKAQLPVRLTKRSSIDVHEVAFFYGTKAPDSW